MFEYICGNWHDIFSAIGLLLTLLGAALTAWPMRISKEDAGNLATAVWPYETPLENAKLPLAVSLLKNSRGAMKGLLLIAAGSFIQLIPIAARLLV